MGDNDTPEIEQNETPKQPSGGALGWYKPPTEPSRVLNEGDDEPQVSDAPHTLTEDETKEQLFRAAAIKCAKMEEELAEIMSGTTEEEFNQGSKIFTGTLGKFPHGSQSISSYVEKIYNSEGKSVSLNFNDGIANDAKVLGIATNRELRVSLYTDEETRETYEMLAKTNPELLRDSSTMYYFTEGGEYKKSVRISKRIPADPMRKRLYPDRQDLVVNIYESEMTAGDFEIAGRALKMLKNRVLGISDEAEQQEAQGK